MKTTVQRLIPVPDYDAMVEHSMSVAQLQFAGIAKTLGAQRSTPYEEDIIVLLGAVRDLIVTRGHSLHVEAWADTVDNLGSSIISLHEYLLKVEEENQ